MAESEGHQELRARGAELLALKDIRQHDAFTGKQEDFESWIFAFEAEAGALGWGELIREVAEKTEPIRPQEGWIGLIARNLFLLLAHKTKSKAQVLVRHVPDQNGLEALRMIYREFRPQGNIPSHTLLTTIIQPRWWNKAPHSSRPFPDVLLDWDDLILQYERDSKEVLSDALKCATVMGYAPESVRLMLTAAPHEYRTNHGLMRQLLKEQHVSHAGLNYVPSSSWSEEPVPMDVGAIGWDKPKCRTCGKLGHLAKDCWWNVKGSKGPKGKGKGEGAAKESKGQGKGKGEKGNKNPHADVVCRFCKKKGHIEKNCWAKKGVNNITEQGSPDETSGGASSSGVHHVESLPQGWCMQVSHDQLGKQDETCILIDGGSDEHCCTEEFGRHFATEPSDAQLRDAQGHRIPIIGEKTVHMEINGGSAQATFQVGPFSKNILSAGKLLDKGYDVVLSKRHGCYLGKASPGSYCRVDLVRTGNTFCLPVRVREGSRSGDGSVRAIGASLASFDERMSGSSRVGSGSGGAASTRVGDEIIPEVEDERMQEEEGPLEHAFAEPPAPADVPQPLHRHSLCRLMKDRLRELGQNTFGSKRVLWTRIQETERKIAEEVAYRAAIQREQEARTSGATSSSALPVPTPKKPSEFEQQIHDLTHTPAAEWCEFCVMGHGTEKLHKRVDFDKASPHPLILFDYAFQGDTASVANNAAPAALIIVDRNTGMMKAVAGKSKAATDMMVEELTKFIKQLGYSTVELRCDGEPATVGLQVRVQEARAPMRTILSTGKLRDSASMGGVESVTRWWRAKLRTLKLYTEAKYKQRIDPAHCLWQWAVRHAAWITSRYRIRSDGFSSFFSAFGHEYVGEICIFGEVVLAKLPVSHAGVTNRGKRIPKHESTWVKGIWCGKTEDNDSHIVVTTEGRVTARTVKRMPVETRFDQEIFKGCTGLPWDPLAVPTAYYKTGKMTPIPATSVDDSARPDIQEETPVKEDPREYVAVPQPPLQEQEVLEQEDVIPIPVEVEPPTTEEAENDDPMLQPTSGMKRSAEDTPGEEPEGETTKRIKAGDVSLIGVCEVESLDLCERLDYSSLIENAEFDKFNYSGFSDEDVRVAKVAGLELLDEFSVYEVVPTDRTYGKKFVDTKWEIAQRGGKLKARVVGREFRFLDPQRDGVFAPASLGTTSRLIDFLVLKEKGQRNNPMVTFVADCVSAFLQTDQKEECYVVPPLEWKAARKQAGLSEDCMWKLKKQLPGQRAAGHEWTEFAAERLASLGLTRNDSLPYLFHRKEGNLTLEIHIDDLYGCGLHDEIEKFIEELRRTLRIKASCSISEGVYEHLKRTRVKTREAIFIQPHEKHVQNILEAMGMQDCKPSVTPHLDEERPSESKPLDRSMTTLYRSCVGSAIYLSGAEYDLARLKRLCRYLKGTADLGVMMKHEGKKFEKHTVVLKGFSDTDWASDKTDRKSTACGIITFDDVPVASMVRKQSLVALSSGEAEFYGINMVATETYLLKQLLEWLGYRVVWQVLTDPSSAKSMCQRLGVGRVRHLDVRSLWVQWACKTHGLKIVKIPGESNPADIGTKSHTGILLRKLRDMCGLVPKSTLPRVPAEVSVT